MIQGVIQAITTEPFKDMFKHEVTVDGIQYNVYKKSNVFPVNIGEAITLEVTNPNAMSAKIVDGKYQAKPAPQMQQQPVPSGPTGKDITIIRQAAFKAACEYLANRSSQDGHEDIVHLAKRLEQYALTGN